MKRIVLGLTLVAAFAELISYRKPSDFPVDENNRLSSHWLLHSNNRECKSFVDTVYGDFFYMRELGAMDGGLYKALASSANESCTMVCLERGAAIDLLPHIFPEKRYHRSAGDSIGNARKWFFENCQKVELGFASFHQNPVAIYWLKDKNPKSRFEGGVIEKHGEKGTIWQQTQLGHTFELVDQLTDESLGRFMAKFNGIVVVGGRGGSAVDTTIDPMEAICSTLEDEFQRMKMVKRTFTPLGFGKAKLPLDVWNSISTYYYNNQQQLAREQWELRGGFYVNWWQQDVFMIGMPWGLKTYWQGRLKTLVEAWSGVELELTDIYGMRRYEDGARLLHHVDRINTHAASLIINVAQQNIREPWPVEIYDLAGRLHEIPMDPGDIVYYESARCLHGRTKPLQGDFYVNLFAHYRPKDDPYWYNNDNLSLPQQLLVADIRTDGKGVREGDSSCEHVRINVTEGGSGRARCGGQSQGGAPTTTLAPSGEVVGSADDLIAHWRATSTITTTDPLLSSTSHDEL